MFSAEETCPACTHRDFRSRRITQSIAVDQCRTCGLMLSAIEPPATFQEEFERIDETAYHGAVSFVRKSQAETIVAAAKAKVPHGLWLDVGCSFGLLLAQARSEGYDILGVEPDDRAAEQARGLLGEAKVYHGLMADDACADASVDIISMLDVLEHIPPQTSDTLLQLLARKLKPGGLLVVKVPSRDGLYFKLAHLVARFWRGLAEGAIKRLWQSEYEFPHLLYFDVRSLSLLLERAGFRVSDHQYLEEVPNNTVRERLAMDDTIPTWQALLFTPVFYGINLLERVRGKSDALLVLAARD